MYKKVFKGNKEYWAIYIEDINNLVGDLAAVIGTTKKQVFSHNEFDNYVTLYDFNKPNLIIDAAEHHNKYLTICKINNKDNYTFELFSTEEFADNFIDELKLLELKEVNGLLLEEFKETLDFIKEQDEKMNNFCDALEQLSPGEYCNCFLYSKYEEKLLDMLCKAMRLTEHETATLMWWIYDMEWGTKAGEADIFDEDGNWIDLTTIEKLYNYLIGE